jgi:hypothetical protein
MPKYVNKQLGSTNIDTESGSYPVDIKVDTLGYTTITFGSSFTLRLDYNNVEALEDLLSESKSYIEDKHLGERAGKQEELPFGDDRDHEWTANDPRSW